MRPLVAMPINGICFEYFIRGNFSHGMIIKIVGTTVVNKLVLNGNCKIT